MSTVDKQRIPVSKTINSAGSNKPPKDSDLRIPLIQRSQEHPIVRATVPLRDSPTLRFREGNDKVMKQHIPTSSVLSLRVRQHF